MYRINTKLKKALNQVNSSLSSTLNFTSPRLTVYIEILFFFGNINFLLKLQILKSGFIFNFNNIYTRYYYILFYFNKYLYIYINPNNNNYYLFSKYINIISLPWNNTDLLDFEGPFQPEATVMDNVTFKSC